MIEKLVYYRQHPIEFIEDNIKIVHVGKGIIPMKLYPFQKNAINLLLSSHFTITLKSRQVGYSTIMQAYSLWCAIFYANFRVLILSTGIRTAIKFLGDIKGMYDRLPEEYQSTLKEQSLYSGEKRVKGANNKTELSLGNGSSIIALPARSPAARGSSVNLLIIDEGAFVPGIQENFNAVYPTLSRAFQSQQGKPFGCCIISTPNGVGEGSIGGWYYKQYMNAVEGKSKFVPMRVHWTEVDEYDEAWYLDQCATCGWDYRLIQSELELSFLGSGDTYLPSKILNMIATKPAVRKSLDNALWVFKEPEPGHKYVMGVDFAYGTGNDASAIQILDAVTLEQVAEFLSTTILTKDFATTIIELSTFYNNAYANIERNAGGKILIEQILDMSPEIEKRLFRDSSVGDVLPDKPKFGSILQSKSTDIGTQITSSSRDIVLSNMYNIVLDKYIAIMPDYISNEDSEEVAKLRFLQAKSKEGQERQAKVYGIINSERLLLQLLGFVRDKTGKPQGEKDDAVMSFAHALYLWAKARQYLLKDVSNMIPEKVEETPQIKFEKIYNDQLMRSINPGRSQKDIDKFIMALDAEDEDFLKATDDPKTAAIWGAFIN